MRSQTVHVLLDALVSVEKNSKFTLDALKTQCITAEKKLFQRSTTFENYKSRLEAKCKQIQNTDLSSATNVVKHATTSAAAPSATTPAFIPAAPSATSAASTIPTSGPPSGPSHWKLQTGKLNSLKKQTLLKQTPSSKSKVFSDSLQAFASSFLLDPIKNAPRAGLVLTPCQAEQSCVVVPIVLTTKQLPGRPLCFIIQRAHVLGKQINSLYLCLYNSQSNAKSALYFDIDQGTQKDRFLSLLSKLSSVQCNSCLDLHPHIPALIKSASSVFESLDIRRFNLDSIPIPSQFEKVGILLQLPLKLVMM